MKIILILTALILSSCATMYTPTKCTNCKVKHNRNPNTGLFSESGFTTIVIKTKEEVQASETLRAQNEMREPLVYIMNTFIAIQINLNSITLDGANTNSFIFVVKDNNGKIIYRKEGTSSIPSVPAGNGYWYNTEWIYFTKEIEYPFTVIVINKLLGGQDEFIITQKDS